MNFGTFYPGKIFKCSLRLTNISDSRRTLSLSFDTTSPTFLESEFSASIPMLGKPPTLPNTELSHKCWYLMLPPSKTFEKTLLVTLDPKQKAEIGVVIKSPQIVYPKKFCSVLRLSLDENDPLQKTASDSVAIFSTAEVDTPKLECSKELVYTENDTRIVPLVVRFEGADIQRLKIPFKNNGGQELELALSIVQFPGGGGNEKVPVNVSCTPNVCKIPAKGMGLVNISILKQSEGEEEPETDRQQRVLIAKVKNTQMLYYYVLDLTLIMS